MNPNQPEEVRPHEHICEVIPMNNETPTPPEEVMFVYIAFGIGALLGFLAGVATCIVASAAL